MEYLVTMTTRVPDGTPEQAVADVRAREAAHSRDLAASGHLLRLWRPPLQPGEWRTFGLFAAAGDDELEEVLASMPLRIWRTDQVTPLAPHPNDPVPAPAPGPPEFLTYFTLVIPEGTPDAVVADTDAAEAAARASWPGRGTCCGCGGCHRVVPARWACGGPLMPLRCRRSCGRYRWTPG
jgi:muconolactone delta-isomerase